MQLKSRKPLWYLGVSLLAVCAPAFSGTAFAQTTGGTTGATVGDAAAAPADDAQTVVVVGVRRSLKTAQQIKKDADTVVDSITATDIGAFPDKSVAEALQRVAGITVTRFAATGDTAHFSAEPSGVIVRGLSQVRSEFNGRDTFSANSSRGLSWGDVSPELMAGVDTYKNQTAELIEGGIAGSINLRTRVPFDSKGQLIALTIEADYGDIAKSFEPSISGIYSNRWDTSFGEVGIMANYAFSKVSTRSEGIQYGRMGIFDPSVFNTAGKTYIPTSIAFRDNLYTRTRNGAALAAQWQNHDHTMLATLQYNQSRYQNNWDEYVATGSAFGLYAVATDNVISSKSTVQVAPGTDPFTFDSAGNFQTGVMVSDNGWWGQPSTDPFNSDSSHVAMNAEGRELVHACYGWDGCSPVQKGATFSTDTRYSTGENNTQDVSFNFKWDVNDHIKTNFDVQYVDSTVTNYDMSVGMSSYANLGLDTTGDLPKMSLYAPTNVNLSPGGLTNANAYRYGYIMDHTEDSEGNEFATRFDVQYDFDSTWLNSLKVGVRYSDREQTVRWGAYNWANVANEWTSNYTNSNTGCSGFQSDYYNVDRGASVQRLCDADHNPATPDVLTTTFAGYPTGSYFNHDFREGFFGGGLLNETSFVYVNPALLRDRTATAAAFSQGALGVGQWNPICSHAGSRSDELAGSCYRQQEILDVGEKTTAAYLMLKFGGADATVFGTGFTLSGNIGVRYVETEDASTGGNLFSNIFQTGNNACRANIPTIPGATVIMPYTTSCYLLGATKQNALAAAMPDTIPNPNAGQPGEPATLPNPDKVFLPTTIVGSPDDLAFANGAQELSTINTTHKNWLPSLNLKLKLNDQWQLRFAASRALSRPDMGYLKNYIQVGPNFDTSAQAFCVTVDTLTGIATPIPGCTKSPTLKFSGNELVAITPEYRAGSQNPRLKPTVADQFDFTVEDYFSSVGSFTFDIFYKKFYDYIQFGNYYADFTNNGVTRSVRVNGPVNSDGATIKGFEVAYQRFFDFLPSPWNGLGIQTNYTHVVNTGVTNTNLTSVSGDGSSGTGGNGLQQANDSISVDVLEGLSKDSYNVVVMYEKGPWALRTAYNWRSKYLVTAVDCCVGFPVWQDAQGYLDASMRYKVSDNIELSLQGSNLLNTRTVLLQQVTDSDAGGLLKPNAWFQNDRRIQASVRLKY